MGETLIHALMSLSFSHNADMRGFVGVTDHDWYEFLHAHPQQTEVNFWRPKDKNRFGTISPDEPFFFKLRAAYHNRVVGGGLFVGWELLPLSAAWQFYGEGNGAGSLTEFRALIGGHNPLDPEDDPEIGCILLRDVRFFTDREIAGPPRNSRLTSCRARRMTWTTRATQATSTS